MKKCPRRSYTSPRADPREWQLPWAVSSLPAQPGRAQAVHTDIAQRAGADRGRVSVCARACGHRYTPRRWNQRYCQDPECLREVRRWQSRQRQRRRRASPRGRQRHRQAQRARRLEAKIRGQTPTKRSTDRARGHAGEKSSDIFCGRTGCYEPPRESLRTPACYCSTTCRTAMRRVRDRERKWLSRVTLAGRMKRHYEYEAARRRRVGHSGNIHGTRDVAYPRRV